MTNHHSLAPRSILCSAIVFFVLLLSPSAWSSVFLHWGNSAMPPATSLGITDVVFSWATDFPISLTNAACKQGYRVYVEVPLQQAKGAAEAGAKNGWTGLIISLPDSNDTDSQTSVATLRSAYPKLRFLLLNPNGKQPQMRGSIVIKHGSVLEVSSPTMQPWIDTNLAAIKVEQRAHEDQVPLYTFSWIVPDQGQERSPTASDFSLAVAEAGAFHADLVLQLDERLQKALSNHGAEAWNLWHEVRSMANFYSSGSAGALKPAVNVAVVVDQFDASDEVLNLLARHNIPFQVLLASDLKQSEAQPFDVVIVLANLDQVPADAIVAMATRGGTVVLVDAHGSHPWQSGEPARLNEHTVSYGKGSGKILELSEPVTDPEVFAQDIRRLLGKNNSLLTLWNGLTTIAVPYKDRDGLLNVIELVNYATDPLQVQLRVKGSFTSIRYETPEHGCCQPLVPVSHDGFTEFVIPELRIAGRVHLAP